MKNSMFTLSIELDGHLSEDKLKELRQACLITIRDLLDDRQLKASIKSNVCGD